MSRTRTLVVQIQPHLDLCGMAGRLAAARVLPFAVRMHCDRIRVEDGARTLELTVDQVRRYVEWQRLSLQPHAVPVAGRDYDVRQPNWRGAHLRGPREAPLQTVTQEGDTHGPR